MQPHRRRLRTPEREGVHSFHRVCTALAQHADLEQRPGDLADLAETLKVSGGDEETGERQDTDGRQTADGADTDSEQHQPRTSLESTAG